VRFTIAHTRAIAVGGAAVGDSAELLEDRLVVAPAIEACRTDSCGIVRRLPGHPHTHVVPLSVLSVKAREAACDERLVVL
jgi:hypothetical protein